MKEKIRKFLHVTWHIINVYLFIYYFGFALPHLISGDNTDIMIALVVTPFAIWDLWKFNLVPAWKWFIVKLDNL